MRRTARQLLCGTAVVGAAVVCVLAGCSSSARIAAGFSNVGKLATGIEQEANEIIRQVTAPDPDLPAVARSASQIASSARSIRSEVDAGHRALTGVQDSVPWWADLLMWLGIAVAVAGVVFVLWRSGVLAFVGGLLHLVTPHRKRAEASLAAAVLDAAKPEGVRELIAVKRATDPQFDAAFVAAKEEARASSEYDQPKASGGVPIEVEQPTAKESAQ